jgi:hypothetical protein
MKCYAASLGNCSDIQSKEHYTSKGLFTNEIITIAGQNFLNGEHKELPLKALGLKILCKYHNERLSSLDVIGIDFFRSLTKARQHQLEVAKLSRGKLWNKITFSVNAAALEQWMAKMAVGVLFENPTGFWHINNLPAITPPIEIIEAIYGMSDFKYPMGLYSINAEGDIGQDEERVDIQTLTHTDTNGYMGCMINLRNVHFLMWLSSEELTKSNFISPTGAVFGLGRNEPMYHIKEFNFTTGGRLVGILKFDWLQEAVKSVKI